MSLRLVGLPKSMTLNDLNSVMAVSPVVYTLRCFTTETADKILPG